MARANRLKMVCADWYVRPCTSYLAVPKPLLNANPYFSLPFSATTPYSRCSKNKTTELQAATHRSRSLARRPTFTAFEEVQVV